MTRYNEAPEVQSPAPLVIEDAEVEIIELCKRTVVQMLPRVAFAESVNNIIASAQKRVKNERLRERIATALKRYAFDTLARERRLMYEQALFYSAVIIAMQSKATSEEANRYKRDVIDKDFDKDFIKSRGFASALENLNSTMPAYDGREWRYKSDDFRQGLPLDLYHKRYTESVKEVLGEIVSGDAREEYGVNVNLRNIAEMTVRYDNQAAMVDAFKQSGTRLVYIVPHANCSKRCEKYQVGGSKHPSGLYSLDGSYGKTSEGISFVPLEFATNNPEDTYITREGRVYQNGCITGFNCRHTLKAYVPNEKIRPIPTAVIDRRRAVEEKQREYEREIRYQKRLAVQASGINNALAKRARKKAKALTSAYERYSERNNVAFYRERTRILDNERLFTLRPQDRKALKKI